MKKPMNAERCRLILTAARQVNSKSGGQPVGVVTVQKAAELHGLTWLEVKLAKQLLAHADAAVIRALEEGSITLYQARLIWRRDKAGLSQAALLKDCLSREQTTSDEVKDLPGTVGNVARAIEKLAWSIEMLRHEWDQLNGASLETEREAWRKQIKRSRRLLSQLINQKENTQHADAENQNHSEK